MFKKFDKITLNDNKLHLTNCNFFNLHNLPENTQTFHKLDSQSDTLVVNLTLLFIIIPIARIRQCLAIKCILCKRVSTWFIRYFLMFVFYEHTIEVLYIDYEYISYKTRRNVGKIKIWFLSNFEKINLKKFK